MQMLMLRLTAFCLLAVHARADVKPQSALAILTGTEDADVKSLEGSLEQSMSELTAPVPEVVESVFAPVEEVDNSQGLIKLLTTANKDNKMMLQKEKELQKKISEDAVLEKSLRKVAAKRVAQEEVELSAQAHRADVAVAQEQKAERKVLVERKAMKILGMRLKKAEDEKKKAVTGQQSKELSETQAKLKKVEAANEAMKKQVTLMQKMKKILAHKAFSSMKSGEILRKESSLLKKQLADEVAHEGQLEQASSAQNNILVRARTEFQNLRMRAEGLADQANHNAQALRSATVAANTAQAELAQVEAENRQLRSAVPVLEKEAEEAARERDAIRRFPVQGQNFLAPGQGQYPQTIPQDLLGSANVMPRWAASAALGPLLRRTQLPSFPMGMPAGSQFVDGRF